MSGGATYVASNDGWSWNKPVEIIEGRCSRCGQLALFADHAGCEKRRSDE